MNATPSLPPGYGYNAFCYGEGTLLPVQVVETAAGFYIGTIGDDGLPFSRESEETYAAAADAQAALDADTWTLLVTT